MDILIDAEYAGLTVREVLRRKLGYSANMIKKLKFSENGILVDGKFVTVRHELSPGETLSLAVEDKESDVSPYTIPVDLPIGILYEDEHVTAVDKPFAMPSHPSLGHKLDTVSNALAYRYREKNYVFRPVNRLDRDTSGCMLTANTKSASYKMYLSMREGRIYKEYIAVTDGCPDEKNGVLVSFIRRVPDSIIEREETSESDESAQKAVTEYEVLVSNGKNSIIKLSPVTGRTHQIRVQLSGIGCPVTGDDLYGTPSELIARQALHSWRTTFPHPETKKEITVTAPLPDDMRALVVSLFGEETLRTLAL